MRDFNFFRYFVLFIFFLFVFSEFCLKGKTVEKQAPRIPKEIKTKAKRPSVQTPETSYKPRRTSLPDIYQLKKTQLLMDPVTRGEKKDGERKLTLTEEAQTRSFAFLEWLLSRKKAKSKKEEKQKEKKEEKISVKDAFKQMEKDVKKAEAKIDNWKKNVIFAASKELQEKSKELEEAQKNIDEFDTYLSRNPENERLKKMKIDLEKQLSEKEKAVESATQKLIEVNKKLVDLKDDFKKMEVGRVEEMWESLGVRWRYQLELENKRKEWVKKKDEYDEFKHSSKHWRLSVEERTKQAEDKKKEKEIAEEKYKEFTVNPFESYKIDEEMLRVAKDNFIEAERLSEDNLRDVEKFSIDDLNKEIGALKQSVEKDRENLRLAQKIPQPEGAGSPTAIYPEAVEKIRIRLEKNEQILKKSEKKLKVAKIYKTKKEELEKAQQNYNETKDRLLKVIGDAESKKSLTEDIF